MKTILIKCNSIGEITIDEEMRTNGIMFDLVQEDGRSIAKYEFDSDKISNLTRLPYKANYTMVDFVGTIQPTMKYEIVSNDD